MSYELLLNSQSLYLLLFYTIGGILGFLSFRFSYTKTKLENTINGIVTIGLGVFLAYILAEYLNEEKYFSTKICMLIGGIASFGLPDLVIKYYPMLSKLALRTVLNKTSFLKGKKNESIK